jgi:hypothetical protein
MFELLARLFVESPPTRFDPCGPGLLGLLVVGWLIVEFVRQHV